MLGDTWKCWLRHDLVEDLVGLSASWGDYSFCRANPPFDVDVRICAVFRGLVPEPGLLTAFEPSSLTPTRNPEALNGNKQHRAQSV